MQSSQKSIGIEKRASIVHDFHPAGAADAFVRPGYGRKLLDERETKKQPTNKKEAASTNLEFQQ